MHRKLSDTKLYFIKTNIWGPLSKNNMDSFDKPRVALNDFVDVLFRLKYKRMSYGPRFGC